MAISRAEVVHVARLARLALTEEELDRFAGQLDAILEAVGKVAELDLSDVEPTLHPLALANVLAEDEPRPCLDGGGGARQRAGGRGRRVPRPGRMTIDTLRLTAEEAMGLVERGEASGAELHRAYLDAIAERDPELHAFLCTVEEPEGDGVPIALKDVISTRGVATTAASKILEGYKPVYDATVAARCKAAGLPLLGKTNLDEFAMGSSTENSAYGPTRNPWDPTPRSRWLVRRLDRGRRGRARAVGARLRHRRLDQAAGVALRRRRPAPDLRHRLALRDRRLRLQPRPGRPDRQDRARLRAAAPDRRRPRPARLDHRRAAGADRAAARPRTSRACASACPRS